MLSYNQKRDVPWQQTRIRECLNMLQQAHLEDLGFCGTTYVLSDDRKLRGLDPLESDRRAKEISYDGLVDLMTESNNVVGMF